MAVKAAKRKRKAESPAELLARRINVAQGLLGTSIALAAVRNRIGQEPAYVVAAAIELKVDPRWLATGETSRAGKAAIQFCRSTVGFAKDDELLPMLAMMPEPDLGAGICRYCLCTDEHGCGDCYWVDPASTICSSCLQTEDA